MPESDRDILIDLRAKVTEIHRDMTQPGGRVPKLEETVEEHGARINSASGGLRVVVWILGGLGALFIGLAAVVLEHILGGK